jgi:2-methylcitrate dehydratase PrpD
LIEGRAGLYALYARSAWDADTLLAQLGTFFYGEQVSFKPWPSCRGTHALIEGALDLRLSQSLRVEDIEVVHTRGGPIQRMLTEPCEQKLRPQTAIDAKFSIPFTVALALVHGEVTLERFSPSALADERVLALAPRITFETDPVAEHSEDTGGGIEIRLRDGRSFARQIVHPRGHTSKPMAWPELIAKFTDCCAHAVRPMNASRTQRLIDSIRHLDEVDDVGAALWS